MSKTRSRSESKRRRAARHAVDTGSRARNIETARLAVALARTRVGKTSGLKGRWPTGFALFAAVTVLGALDGGARALAHGDTFSAAICGLTAFGSADQMVRGLRAPRRRRNAQRALRLNQAVLELTGLPSAPADATNERT